MSYFLRMNKRKSLFKEREIEGRRTFCVGDNGLLIDPLIDTLKAHRRHTCWKTTNIMFILRNVMNILVDFYIHLKYV